MLDSSEGNVKAEKAVYELTATEDEQRMKTEDELDVLFQKLNKIFGSEKLDESYSIYSNFIKLQKVEGMSLNDFIIQYEHLHHKMTQDDKILPHTVAKFKLEMVQTPVKMNLN